MYVNFEKFVIELYKLLGKGKESKCFLAGSFIIRDDDEQLFNSLERDNRWVPIESHKRFKKYPWISKIKVRDRRISNTTGLELDCGERGKRIIRSIKYYQFKWSPTSKVPNKMKKKAKYVYLKLERSLSTEFIHILHVMQSKKKKITGKRWKEYRRDEKCKKNCEQFGDDHKLFNNKDDKNEVINWWKMVVNNVGKNKKTGIMPINSFYIPKKFGKKLIKKIESISDYIITKKKTRKKRYRKKTRQTRKRK